MGKREERKGERNQENKIKGGKRERKAAERGKQEVKKTETNGKKIEERKKAGRRERGGRKKKLGEDKKKEGKKRNASRGLIGGGKKKRREKKKSSPQNRTRVPLMNGHNDQSFGLTSQPITGNLTGVRPLFYILYWVPYHRIYLQTPWRKNI